MNRSGTRIVAFVVLALLGVPLAMHVLMHDLHGHPHEQADAYQAEGGHGDHEHPIVSSEPPQLPNATRVAVPVATVPSATPSTWTSVASTVRNALSFGALRMDDDVGLQPLLSTFLI